MRNNIQSKIDAGYTYDELLSEGLASFDDIARYESRYSLYDEDAAPKPTKVKVAEPKLAETTPNPQESEIDFDF
ncbi:MAG: hypothetical protein WCP16_26535 [Pseudanabaena sp. ELA645]|jgi:hypothetical protein